MIEQEFSRREGQVFVLSKLESRKPPTIAPNWRTSYRLNCSALCAIGRLDVAHAPLQPSFAINWAEIVPVSTAQGNDEGQNRSRGRMAVRLLGQSDCSALQGCVDLRVGTRIFVIDLRVFAPEVLPVLSTYANPTQIEDFESIRFVNSLIGQTPRRPHQISVAPTSGLRARITHALENSEIDLLDRLPPEARSQLTRSICDLAQHANLYGTQLEAFAEGLSCSVHCTLGPPGTGKSYTGVQLIAALDVIRDALLGAGIVVGPITLFSYKNHALDEMVKDVLAHPLLQHKMRRPGALIRCGKPDDPELKSYTEQHSMEEIMWDRTLNERLQMLQLSRQITFELTDLADHLEMHSLALKPGANGQALLREWRPRTQKADAARVLAVAIELLHKLAEALAERQGEQNEREAAEATDGSGRPPDPTRVPIVKDSQEAYEALKMVDFSQPRPYDGPNACIQKLATDAEHWPNKELIASLGMDQPPKDRNSAMLCAWLSGFEPPPRCFAAEEDAQSASAGGVHFFCRSIVHHKGAYCMQFHACRHPDGCTNRRTKIESRAQIPFCDKHRCIATDVAEACSKPSLPGGSSCVDHSCRACVHFHQVLGTPVFTAAPFACDNHQCQMSGCNMIIANATVSFCRQHCCVECFHERSASVRPVLPGRRFCSQHACAVDGCQQLCLPSTEDVVQKLCESHACVACEGPRRRVDPMFPASKLCDQHRCLIGTINVLDDKQFLCHFQRAKGSLFCHYHSCRVCCMAPSTSLSLEICPAVHAFPRNVCAHHPLCSFMEIDGEQCAELADQGGQFCRAHQLAARARPIDTRLIQQTCHGVTVKGRPCKTKGMAPASRTFYCNAHLDQAPADSSSEESDEEESDEEEWEGIDESHLQGECLIHVDQQDFPPGEEFERAPMLQPPPPPLLVERAVRVPYPPSVPLLPSAPPPLMMSPRDSQVHARAGKERVAEPSILRQSAEDNSSDEDDLARAIVTSLTGANVRSCSSNGSMSSDGGAADSSGAAGSSVAAGSSGAADSSVAADSLAAAGSSTATEPSIAASIASPALELDADNVREPDRLDMDPDEMEFFDEDLYGPNDEQLRLQQILGDDLHGAQVEELEELEYVTGNSQGVVQTAKADIQVMAAGACNWSWSLPLDLRWSEAVAFLRGAAGVLTELRSLAQPYLDEARRGRAEASADAFKKARLIAATVVGGVRRLEPLRAAEPFAAVVEEACEVMEPALMAVLSMRSLRKLELVGDHRQLPAAIPNAWFNLEAAIPSMKISLFERLVTGAAGRGARSNDKTTGGVAPCTVLDEQRRMRPAISDLTRGHYSDLVCIQDHACTVAQRIGDRCKGSIKATLQVERAAWASAGELVPGVAATEFFWDLPNNEQGRPVAGARSNVQVQSDALTYPTYTRSLLNRARSI